VIRWGVQRGTTVIPKTTKKERLAENIGLFDFSLTNDEMKAISGLNQNKRFNDPGVFCEAAFNHFFPIFE
jgi:D-xylose reductase